MASLEKTRAHVADEVSNILSLQFTFHRPSVLPARLAGKSERLGTPLVGSGAGDGRESNPPENHSPSLDLNRLSVRQRNLVYGPLAQGAMLTPFDSALGGILGIGVDDSDRNGASTSFSFVHLAFVVDYDGPRGDGAIHGRSSFRCGHSALRRKSITIRPDFFGRPRIPDATVALGAGSFAREIAIRRADLEGVKIGISVF